MTSSDTPKTILLRGDPLGSEGNAGNANVRPGHLVTAVPDGDVIPNATAAVDVPRTFAREPDYMGGGIGHEFASGERVPYWNCRRGDWVYAWLAQTEVVEAGDLLEASTAGNLREHDQGAPIAMALEDVDAEYADGAVRIKVEIL